MAEYSAYCKNFLVLKGCMVLIVCDACFKRKIKKFDSRKLQLLEENMHEVHILHIIPPPPFLSPGNY